MFEIYLTEKLVTRLKHYLKSLNFLRQDAKSKDIIEQNIIETGLDELVNEDKRVFLEGLVVLG